jgi:hypothetical protein
MKIEGGSGGRRGHSNMNHWVTTEEIKAATRVGRRCDARRVERRAKLAGPKSTHSV